MAGEGKRELGSGRSNVATRRLATLPEPQGAQGELASGICGSSLHPALAASGFRPGNARLGSRNRAIVPGAHAVRRIVAGPIPREPFAARRRFDAGTALHAARVVAPAAALRLFAFH